MAFYGCGFAGLVFCLGLVGCVLLFIVVGCIVWFLFTGVWIFAFLVCLVVLWLFSIAC